MSTDQSSLEYNADEIFGPYQKSELPYSYESGSIMKNSEKLFNCWYIENPINKDLVKSMTLRFGPNVEKEFIVVLKAPANVPQAKLASFV